MSAAFTPGPWRVLSGEVVSANDPICSMPTLYRATREAKAQLAADAHLIAAAPSLYEALAELEASIERRWEGESDRKRANAVSPRAEDALNAARAALAKARGEQVTA